MKKDKDEDVMQGEELSRCLDELNAGNYPVLQDKEIEELIEMAALVKESQGPQELPRVLIDRIVDDLATELGNKKNKKNTSWLYGSVACAAAAVVLALSVQFLIPPGTDKNIAQEMNGSVREEKVAALADSENHNAIPTQQPLRQPVATASLENVTSSENITSRIPAPKNEPTAATSITKVIEEIVQVAQVKTEGTEQVAVLEKEKLPEKNMEKNPAMLRMRMDSASVVGKKEESIGKSKSLALSARDDQTIPYGAFASSQPQAISREKTVIIMLNGKEINCNGRQPYIKDNGTIMIPLVVVVEPLGYQVNWNKQTQVVAITRSNQWITAKIGEDIYRSEKIASMPLGDCTELIEDTIYVPLLFFQEILGVMIVQDAQGNIKIKELVH